MKCLILAAGYATRLYPLTENFPKPLLEVAGKPILDWLIDDLETTGLIDEYIVVTNHKFAPIFEDWSKVPEPVEGPVVSTSSTTEKGAMRSLSLSKGRIRIIDDGTTTNEGRLGAVRDIQLGVETAVQDDYLVMAGDNLLSFSLADFVRYAVGKGTSCVMRYEEKDPKRLRKSGVAEIGPDDLVLSMEEKPAEPRSTWCCPPFYYYLAADIARIPEALESGCGIDAPGSLVSWLCSRSPIHAFPMPGPRYDIGTLESYARVQRLFAAP